MSDLSLSEQEELELARARADADTASSLPEGTSPDSPLAKALAEQSGDVVTVETPQGPGRFSRAGQPILSDEEMKAEIGNMSRKAGVAMAETGLAALGGGSHGLTPALAGAESARKTLYSGDLKGIVDAYRKGHQQAESVTAPAEAAHPWATMAGEIATSGPVAESLPARAAVGLGLSALGTGARVPGAITDEDVASEAIGAGTDAAIKAVPFLGAGELAGGVLGKMAGGARALETEANRAGRLQELLKARKAVQSQVGELGRIGTSQGLNVDRNMRAATNVGEFFTPTEQAASEEFLRSEAGRDLIERAHRNMLKTSGSLGRAEDAARQTLEKLKSEATTTAADARFANRVESALGEQTGKVATSMGQRVGLAAIGDLMGSPAQASGLTAPGSLQMIRNANKNFALRSSILDKTASGLEGAENTTKRAAQLAAEHSANAWDAFGEYFGAPPKDKQDAANIHFVKGQMDPNYQRKMSGE